MLGVTVSDRASRDRGPGPHSPFLVLESRTSHRREERKRQVCDRQSVSDKSLPRVPTDSS